MRVEKKVIGNLDKCYSLALLDYNHKQHLLVAAEKVNKCLLYNLEGELEETVWEGPGGTMSMVQIPGTNGQFLATQKFYSPNDSQEASIVIVTPDGNGVWHVQTLVNLPFVHRFDILERNGVQYLIACTLKSGHRCKDDWSIPGKVYGAELPKDLAAFHQGNQLKLTVLKEGMLKNHGYSRNNSGDFNGAIVSCEGGVYQFTPPDKPEHSWEVTQLLAEEASDGLLLDIDDDGVQELITIAPFHGDTITIYKRQDGIFKQVYRYPEKLEFLHAMFGGKIGQTSVVICGSRQGKRKLVAIYSDTKGCYKSTLLDKECGAANILHYTHNKKQILIAANREINEIAMYTFLSDAGSL